MDRQAFERDGKTRDDVERCLERICEAARRLGGRAAELMPTQPWRDIRGMEIGCDTPMTTWISISYGIPPETVCPPSRQMRDGPSRSGASNGRTHQGDDHNQKQVRC
jgi:hypothetical protein